MELVQGVPITDYCDQCNLSTRERLELFIAVCQAVQHAHQKGVIHRDIKPTNVLVAIQDGRPTPKIIDFGVAKAIDQRLTEHTLTTAFAQMVGTPLYIAGCRYSQRHLFFGCAALRALDGHHAVRQGPPARGSL
jgi:serine/threonine-protein kinase